MQLNSTREAITLDENGAVITSDQEIGQDYYDELNAAKDDFAFRLNGLTPVASIPEGLVNKWIREGFDFWDAPANEIIRKLRSEDKQNMIISGDKTF